MTSATKLELTDKQFQQIGKALSEPRRVEILKELASCKAPTACGHLVEKQECSAATISHHIKELETCGLITIAREGKYAKLSLQRDVFQAYLDRLALVID